MQTFLQLKEKLRALMWPGGEAARLRPQHDLHFKAAMMDLQKWIDCLRVRNVTVIIFETTAWRDALTVVTAPFGDIRRIYTVANDDWRDPVYYRSVQYHEMACWSRRLFEATAPTVTVGEEMSLGYRASDKSSDSIVGRARLGGWAVERTKLYVAPWIQSNEDLVIEWDGEKNDWLDTDLLDDTYWTVDVEEAISYYVMYKHELFYGDRVLAGDFKRLYDDKLSDLIWKCREYTRTREDKLCESAVGIDGNLIGITQDELDDDASTEDVDQEEEDNVLFVAVGNVGDTGDNALAVADKVIEDGPEKFLALGNLSYNGDYAGDFSAKYQSFITAGTLVPVPGPFDYSAFGNSFATFKAFFDDFVSNDGLHYEATIGPIHFLVYNTEDADGIDSSSAQAEWLQAKLFLSTARWKIVLMNRPPYSSDATLGSDTDLQLPFKDWGADLVIASPNTYERLSVGGFPYINVGTGGHGLVSFGATASGSVLRYNAKYGRLIGAADCDTLTLTFKTVDDDVIDSMTITKTND